MAILIEKEAWLNSQLSLARHTGAITINKELYVVTPQTNDLLLQKFEKLYNKLGRRRFIEILAVNKLKPQDEVKRIMKQELSELKKKKQEFKEQGLEGF